MIRPALAADLPLLQGVEDAADVLLTERLRPGSWWPAPTGAERAAQPGFLLVADAAADGVIGFAHVLELEGAHLEQLSVLPAHGRRGHGRALVRTAMAEAAARGHARMTLRTFADVPWNAPFYASLGFTETEPHTPILRDLIAVEERLGLAALGRRVQMTAQL